jgi:heptosyltransferase-2
MKILIVRLAAMGDLVFAGSLVTRIRKQMPGAHITWAVSDSLTELVALFDVDRIIPIRTAMLNGTTAAKASALASACVALARVGPFDRAVIAHEDARYRLLATAARARSVRMLTPDVPRHSNPIPGRYAGDEYARLLDDDTTSRGPLVERFAPPDLRERIDPPADAVTRPYVVLVPAGGRNVRRSSPLRLWPVERYADLARRLIAEGYRVVLVGDAHDRRVQPDFAGIGVDDRLGATTIRESLSLMRGARLVVSHDTGPMHLARLVRAPVIALFGPQLPSKHVAADDLTVDALWGGARLPCRPCYDPHEPAACTNNLCMQDLSVDLVFEHAMRRLRGPVALTGRV